MRIDLCHSRFGEAHAVELPREYADSTPYEPAGLDLQATCKANEVLLREYDEQVATGSLCEYPGSAPVSKYPVSTMRRRPSRSALAPVFPLCFVAPVLSSSVPLAHCIRVATLRPVDPMFALGRVERRIGARRTTS